MQLILDALKRVPIFRAIAPHVPRHWLNILRTARPSATRANIGGSVDAADEVATLRQKVGHLEAQVLAARYYAHMYRWRCKALAQELWGKPVMPPPAPSVIPPALVDGFSMGGRVPIVSEVEDQTQPSNYSLIYTDDEIDTYVAMVRGGQWSIYGMTDRWLWQALEKYPISGLDVAIMGSMTPWYESTCLRYGGKPTTIEYNRIIVRSSRMKAITVEEFERSPTKFDAAFSISSFEHDGLGQYGDPLDPDGDLKAMKKMRSIVKAGGLLYLSVPMGSDRVIFNAARIYGRLRFPHLTAGWTIVDQFGLAPETMDGDGSAQPVVVLRNERPADA